MIKAVFFDLDDTLVDAMDCHEKANKKVFEKFGLNYEDILLKVKGKDYLGMRMKDIFKDFRNAAGISENTLPLELLNENRERIFIKLVKEKASLYPGVKQTIKNVKTDKAIVAVVSSGTRAYIKTVLEKFDLLKYIDYFLGEEDIKRGKPHPDIYHKAYKLLTKRKKIFKKECLVVEDSANGVKAAKAAGLKVLFVPSKHNVKNIDSDFILKSLKDFKISDYH